MPSARIVQTGIALDRAGGDLGEIVLSCGLAGGLRADLPTGTLLIPREVRRPDGRTLRCDPELIERLAGAARSLGIEPVFDPLLTSDAIVRGGERARWASQGYAGADMETGLLVAPRVAAARVVLDTPDRELSADWITPLWALLKPWNWSQAVWLARVAPRAATRAARVAAGAQGIRGQMRITGQW